MEELVVGWFHASRAAAKKARRGMSPAEAERLRRTMLERERVDRERRMRVDGQERRAAIQRAWWDFRRSLRDMVVEQKAERFAYEQSLE